MEKIYSRRRVRLPKISKVKLIFIIIFSIIFCSVVSFVLAAYPIFEATCENRATSIGVNVSTAEVIKVMKDYEYEDLVSIERKDTGEISMVRARIVPINEMISKITANIKNEIDKQDQVYVSINLGAVTGFSGLSGIGPKFRIKMEAAGNVTAKLNSEFVSVRN